VVEQRRSSLAPSCLLLEPAGAVAGPGAGAGEGEGAGSEGLSDVGGSSDVTDEEDEDLEFLDAEVRKEGEGKSWMKKQRG